jgi:murein DD-endopeptidase MepM/ murein hydrolase activator NlpD
MNMKKRAIYLVLAFIMVFNISVVYAETINELKGKQKDTEKQMDKTKDAIKEISNQAKNVSNEIKELDKKLNVATDELSAVEEEIKKLEKNIEKKEEELIEAEANIEEKQDTFNKRLRVMYKTGNAGYIEILLSSTSISDFLSRQDMLKSIAKHDTELITYMKDQRDIIDARKAELNSQKTKVEVSKNKLEVRRRDLAKATRAKEDMMNRLKEDHIALEKEYDSLNDLAKSIEADIVKKQVNNNPYSGGTMSWPVPGYSRVSSPFGYRIHPILKRKKFHSGIDIPAPTGSNVIAGAEGTVIHSGSLGGYGKVIMIDHGGGIVTLYAHNSRLIASNGQSVDKGDVIAKIGSTGMSTGPHSHFEVRKNGAYVNPIPWVKGN